MFFFQTLLIRFDFILGWKPFFIFVRQQNSIRLKWIFSVCVQFGHECKEDIVGNRHTKGHPPQTDKHYFLHFDATQFRHKTDSFPTGALLCLLIKVKRNFEIESISLCYKTEDIRKRQVSPFILTALITS